MSRIWLGEAACMGALGWRVTVMLSCQVVGEVCVVVPDQVEILARLGMGTVEVGGEDAHGGEIGELNEPGSKEER